MSLMTRTKDFILQYETTVTTDSGAKKVTWADLKSIKVSISQVNQSMQYQSAKYLESTHVGLTNTKGIKAGKNQLKDSGGNIYQILSAAGDHRVTNLLLKKVET